jgi:hypothetical protein
MAGSRNLDETALASRRRRENHLGGARLAALSSRTKRLAECVIMDEKRAVSRRRTYLEAQLSSQDGIAWAQGVVRNLSDAGALIESANASIPDTLNLSIPQTGLRTRARVAWRHADRTGLRFDAPPVRVAAPKSIASPYDDDANY